MKKTLLLAFALILSAATFAQQQLATLNHHDETTDEDEITVYYGQSALINALEQAENGDIITLSPGTFNSVNITKPVTIRGAGMFPDTAAGTEATTLINSYMISVGLGDNPTLYMEGIYNANEVKYGNANSPQFVKCYFSSFVYNSPSGGKMQNATFVNCIIQKFQAMRYSTDGVRATDTRFVNSAILDLDGYGNPELVNCVAKVWNGYDVLNTMRVLNSILYYNASWSSTVNAQSSYYSIGFSTAGTSSSHWYYNFNGISDHHIANFHGTDYSILFKNFDGSFSAGKTFELQETIASTYLGNDDTQVGMYGGAMPFDPRVRNPLIGKVTVAPTTTSAGILQVDIQLNEPTNNTNTNTDPNN